MVRARLPGLALMIVAMLAVLLIPLAQELAEPAPLYYRIAEAGGMERLDERRPKFFLRWG